jgi:hypothetical protein
MHPAEAFVDALVAGTAQGAASLLAAGAQIDDPREGRVIGGPALERWIDGTRRWLAGLDARPDPVRVTVQGTSAVVERLLHVRVEGEERQLPVAVATECDAGGRVRAARIYLSFWTLDRVHRVRGPVLPAREDLTLAPPVGRYHEALARGDVDGVLACYQRDATLREPAGEPWVHRGPRGLRRLYGTMFSNGGGLALEHANAVDDGVACALEYTVVRWGRTPLPPQAGLVVYERGRTGLIRATRVYDDVDPPRE